MLTTRELVYTARRFGGSVRVPGDKSIAHRALILGAIADGRQTILGLPVSRDVRATAESLRRLGATVDPLPDGTTVVFGGNKPKSPVALNADNSGTTARLLCGLAAGTGVECTIDGDESLRKRPMTRVADPLGRMGARVITAAGGTLPLSISPRPLSGRVHRPDVASAQVKSALLIAGLYAAGTTTVIESIPTRDHTERMMGAMGAALDLEGGSVSVAGGTGLTGTRVEIPGDFSSAAVFLAAAACIPDASVRVLSVGINPSRTAFLDVLDRMGCPVECSNETTSGGEPRATLSARCCDLHAVTVSDPAEVAGMIDEFPLLAVLATQAQGTTVVRGAGELRRKECDRIDAMATNLIDLGAAIETFEDGFAVTGPCPMKATTVSSYGDHRIAMAMALAALMAKGDTIIYGASDVTVSYPDFFDDLRLLLR